MDPPTASNFTDDLQLPDLWSDMDFNWPGLFGDLAPTTLFGIGTSL